MISVSDFVRLPYTQDLTEAGLLYARRVLPRLRRPIGAGLYAGVRRTAAATAVQLALRRHLVAEGIAFGVRPPMPFSDPEQYNIEIGGRSCELLSFLISRPPQIDALATDPGLALRAPALVPLDRLSDETSRLDDRYLFAFVCATEADPPGGTRHSVSTASDAYWMHAMPAAWSRPRTWAPINPLVLKSDGPSGITLRLAGEDGSGAPLDVDIQLPPRQRVEVDAPLYALSHLHTRAPPAGRLGVNSSAHRGTHLIGPASWENIWLQGREITLLGWISRDEFRMRATLIPEGTRVFQFDRTKTRNLAVDIGSLKPMRQLLSGARDGIGAGRIT